MKREGNRDTPKLVCWHCVSDVLTVPSLMLKRRLENVQRERRNLKTEQHENTSDTDQEVMTASEKLTRNVWTWSEASYFDSATVKNSQRIYSVTTPGRRITTRRDVRHGRQRIGKVRQVKGSNCTCKCCEHFVNTILVYCDQEECLREVVHSTAGRLGMPTGVAAV